MNYPQPPAGLTNGVFCVPHSTGDIQLVMVTDGKSVASIELDPLGAAEATTKIFRASMEAHRQSGRPSPDHINAETKYHFIRPSSVGLGPCSEPGHDCLMLHFGEAQFGVAIPTSQLQPLGQALIAASAPRETPQ